MRVCVVALVLVLASSATASAEWQIKPFIGATFGSETTFTDFDHTTGDHHTVFGVGGVLLGEVLGVEGDFGVAPGFFTGEGEDRLVLASRVTMLSGNVVVAMPRRLTRYTLRPYFVGGFGLVHATTENSLGVLTVGATLPAMDLGGGATGFLSRRIGVNWDARYFRSIGEGKVRGQSTGPEEISFLRLTVALVVRY
jgi:hypothetical protein